MKRFLVLVAIFVAAAACGGAGGGGGATSSTGSSQVSQPNRGATDANPPSKATTPSNGSTTLPSDNVPALQGPPVIRQAQLSVTVGSGTFDSKLTEVRRLVEAQGGYIPGNRLDRQPDPHRRHQLHGPGRPLRRDDR